MPDIEVSTNYKRLTNQLSNTLHKSIPVVTFEVPQKLRGKQRVVPIAKGVAFTPKPTKDYEKDLAMIFTSLNKSIKPDTALFIEVIIYHEYPSTSKVKRDKMEKLEIVPAKQPDCDNVLKIVMDGLEKVAYSRDSLIVGDFTFKTYARLPKIQVSLWEL